jgi:hypothetical protein
MIVLMKKFCNLICNFLINSQAAIHPAVFPFRTALDVLGQSGKYFYVRVCGKPITDNKK